MASPIGLLSGRLALVTGGGSGIGRAVCHVLAREGARVVVADLNSIAAEETKKHLDDIGGRFEHLALPVDVSVGRSVQSLIVDIRGKFNAAPSIVVNSAGITRDNFLLKMDENSWNAVMNVNLKGTFLVTQAAAAAMLDDKVPKSSIINIASIIGKTGNVGQCNYAASKAGVEAFTRTVSKELAKYNIRCNAVLPGFIETPMVHSVPDKVKEKFKALIPFGRMGLPEEVAEVVLFLASDRSSYVTGNCIEVSGGLAT
ncbi:hypothetical protein GHT06_009468 [Daphnia sinensis]|uniref:(3R)-3-hydroxyacyl-CoA dehydrogenase n=1 Tax=Daphnia sinensis TaxID=1820382 RepID=A0AAD5LMY1_9CRUS|nr:hypothetical protein GHT06_009468 [Daphnia sinensis]